MADDLMFLTDDYKSSKGKKPATSGNPVTPIVALLMRSIHDSHITHLMQPTPTYARHLAHELYYDGAIEDLVDELQEVSMGIYPESNIQVQGSSKIEDSPAYFQNLYDQIEQLRKPIKETFIQNIIDECQAEIAHTLYRFKYITT